MPYRRRNLSPSTVLPSLPTEERRIDAADGEPYTRAQFIEEYGEELGMMYWRNGKVYSLDSIIMNSIEEEEEMKQTIASQHSEKIIQITVNRAENLQKTDNFGSSDPYVKFLLNGRPINGAIIAISIFDLLTQV